MRFDLGRHVVSYSSEALANRVLHASLPRSHGDYGLHQGWRGTRRLTYFSRLIYCCFSAGVEKLAFVLKLRLTAGFGN